MASYFGMPTRSCEPVPHPWAVHDESGQLVGFAMISDGIPEPIDEDLVGPLPVGGSSSTSRSRARATRGDDRRDRRTWRYAPAPTSCTRCQDGVFAARLLPALRFTDTGRVMWAENGRVVRPQTLRPQKQ